MGRPWSKEADWKLQRLYGKISTRKLCEKLHRTRTAIRGRAKKLGITKPLKRFTKDEIRRMKADYAQHHNASETARRFNRNLTSVILKLRESGVKFRQDTAAEVNRVRAATPAAKKRWREEVQPRGAKARAKQRLQSKTASCDNVIHVLKSDSPIERKCPTCGVIVVLGQSGSGQNEVTLHSSKPQERNQVPRGGILDGWQSKGLSRTRRHIRSDEQWDE